MKILESIWPPFIPIPDINHAILFILSSRTKKCTIFMHAGCSCGCVCHSVCVGHVLQVTWVQLCITQVLTWVMYTQGDWPTGSCTLLSVCDSIL
jgi:hypothetical protein